MPSFIINIIESLVLVMFVTRYHALKVNRLTFIFFVICFSAQMLFTWQGQSDWYTQTALLAVLLYMYQFLVFKKDSQLYFFASQTALYIIMLSNIISLLVLTVIGISAQEYLHFAIVISKILSVYLMLLFSKTTRIKADNGSILIFNIGVVLITVLSHVLIAPLLAMEAVISDYILTIGIIILTALMFIFLQGSLELHEITLRRKYELDQQKMKNTYNEKLERVNHMFKYFMMSIAYKAKEQGVEEVACMAKGYISQILTPNFNVETGNYYFDTNMSRLLLEFIHNKIVVNTDFVKIKSTSKINDETITDRILDTIKEFLYLAKTNQLEEINIKIEEKEKFFVLTLIIYGSVEFECFENFYISKYEDFSQLKKVIY